MRAARFDARRCAPVALVAIAASAAACTFGGMGDYEIRTCSRPAARTVVQRVGSLGPQSDLALTTGNGVGALAAFTASTTGGACVQGIGPSGFLGDGCTFLANEMSLVPRQPWVVALGAGHAAAIVATTAPCTQGKLLYRYAAPAIAGSADGECASSGAALPAIAPIRDGSSALVAWYATPFASRADPIGGCAAADAAPLVVAIVSAASGTAPSLGASTTLDASGAAVRPAALVATPDASAVIVAAPRAADVGVWSIDPSSSAAPSVSVPSLVNARAVAAAAAGDGSSRLAVVAEIGCAPQAIRLSVGSFAGGFATAVDVAPAGADLAIAPSVAWVASRGEWLVAWVSTTGGPHALARRFTADGAPIGGVIDPSLAAAAAIATADGDIFAFVPSQSGFVDDSLGCDP